MKKKLQRLWLFVTLASIFLNIVLLYKISESRQQMNSLTADQKQHTLYHSSEVPLSKAKSNNPPISSMDKNQNSCSHSDTSLNCVEFIRNYDADTLTVNIPGAHPLFGKNISVRIRGVDTPEMRGKGPCEKELAKKAQEKVERILASAERIDLINLGRDKYFRILADVWVDQKISLKDHLLENQLAYSYDGKTKDRPNWCDRLPAANKATAN